jgi:hypothetical protein
MDICDNIIVYLAAGEVYLQLETGTKPAQLQVVQELLQAPQVLFA